LTDVTDQTGIEFQHTDGSSGQRYIVETVTAGLALLDYDNDGDDDIYLLNGAPLRGAEPEVAHNALYRNDGNWSFIDVTQQAGVGDSGFGLGVAAADYDNDGDLDLYINNYGPNVLYRNNGDGTFEDVTQRPERKKLADGHKVGAGVAFLDMEADGDLDLYSANYVDFTYENHVPRTLDGIPEYAGPKDYNGVPDTLFRNNGDGTFTDVSEESGIAEHAGTGMGLVAADADADGDTDLFVLNDVAGNYFFENDGSGRFEENGLFSGLAYDMNGHERGSMGVDCGDYDNDGLLDFFMTCYQAEFPVLYRNLGDGVFDDVTRLTGAGAGTFQHVTWGVSFGDFDNDGDRDAFVCCGHLQDNIELHDDTSSYLARNVLLMNEGDGKFVDVSADAGDGLMPKLSSRGSGLADLDRDGDLDVVILNSRRELTVLRNDSPAGGHWLQVRLCGLRANRWGVGARVRLVAGKRSWVDEVHAGRGYQSHWGGRLHFGLGPATRIDRIEVDWIGGGSDVIRDVAADQKVTIVEGRSLRIGN
jgi:hypothetical protein